MQEEPLETQVLDQPGLCKTLQDPRPLPGLLTLEELPEDLARAELLERAPDTGQMQEEVGL